MSPYSKNAVAGQIALQFFLCLLSNPLHAQESTIQKCVQADGSISYQQDVCPAGSNGKKFGVNLSGSNTLTLNPNSNHQYSTTLSINGVTVPAFIDTGATFVTVSLGTAQKMNIVNGQVTVRAAETANGRIQMLNKSVPVMKIGKFELYNVELSIVQDSPTLIGMSALSQLKFATENGNLVLSKR